MVARLIVVGIVVLCAFGGVAVVSRMRMPGRGGVPHGLTLVVAAGCHTCERAKTVLDALGHGYRTVDVGEASAFGVSSYAVPYAVVGDRSGSVTMVRRGSAVLTDIQALVAASCAV